MGQAPGHFTLSGKGDAGPFQYQAIKGGIQKRGGHIIQRPFQQ